MVALLPPLHSPLQSTTCCRCRWEVCKNLTLIVMQSNCVFPRDISCIQHSSIPAVRALDTYKLVRWQNYSFFTSWEESIISATEETASSADRTAKMRQGVILDLENVGRPRVLNHCSLRISYIHEDKTNTVEVVETDTD